MAEYVLQDYVSLITKLLQCPKGDEWSLFQRYSHLINFDLVQVLKKVAQNYDHQGDSDVANFLRQWESKIQEWLTQDPSPYESIDNDAYYELIQLLLDSPRSHANTILNRKKSMLDTKLVKCLEDCAQKKALRGDVEQAQYLFDLVRQINLMIHQSDSNEPYIVLPETSQDQRSDQTDSINLAVQDPILASGASGKGISESVIRQDTLSKQLESLVLSLSKLVDSIVNHVNQSPPLFYLDILEKAQEHQWLLTTHELELLLGTKPHCSPPSTEYFRGGWRFVKCGKVGRDRLWQVFKVPLSKATNLVNHNSSIVDSSLRLSTEPDPWLAS